MFCSRYNCFLCNYDICSGCAKSMEAGIAPGVQGGQVQRQEGLGQEMQRQEMHQEGQGQEVQRQEVKRQEGHWQEGQRQEVHLQEDLSNQGIREVSMEEEIRQDIKMKEEMKAKEEAKTNEQIRLNEEMGVRDEKGDFGQSSVPDENQNTTMTAPVRQKSILLEDDNIPLIDVCDSTEEEEEEEDVAPLPAEIEPWRPKSASLSLRQVVL